MKSTSLLRAVYIGAKCNGLASFQVSFQNTGLVAKLTNASTICAIYLAIVLNGIFIWAMSKFLIYPPEEEQEDTLLIVVKLDSSASILRNLIISIVVIVHRKALVNIVNDLHLIAFKIKRLRRFDNFLDQNCMRMVRIQILVMMAELGLCLLTIYMHYRKGQLLLHEIFRVLVMTLLSNGYEMSLSAIHFTVLLTVVQLFRHINRVLTDCVNTIRTISQMDKRSCRRMQMYCDMSDQIDEISSLYEFVTNCNERICHVFSMTMLTVLAISFVMMLCGVNLCLLLKIHL